MVLTIKSITECSPKSGVRWMGAFAVFLGMLHELMQMSSNEFVRNIVDSETVDTAQSSKSKSSPLPPPPAARTTAAFAGAFFATTTRPLPLFLPAVDPVLCEDMRDMCEAVLRVLARPAGQGRQTRVGTVQR
jgi:hypothetical protein